MDFLNYICINIYSIVILICIYIYALKQHEKELTEYKIFLTLVQVTIIMLVFDIFGRFDGKPHTIYSVINFLGNFVIFMFGPVIPSLWILYAYYEIFHKIAVKSKITYLIIAVNAINFFLVLLSQSLQLYYYIDTDNIYHRGNLYWLSVLLMVVLMAVALIMVVENRNDIEKKKYFSLLFFPIPPTICAILQMLFYGLAINLSSVSISLLVVFINIQNHGMNIDYLTGAYNRKKLDIYMKEKISCCNENNSFAAILIDMDDFKFINDTFGHIAGDDALETSVKLIKSCLRKKDFLARFGGDEFCIVLELENINDLESTIRKINKRLEMYNKNSNKQYRLGFSMGYAVYDYNSHMNVEEFQKHIDILMYEEKRINKEMNR
ncbi:MAG: GGDEF domain-containing protein [Lachnospiraceae bacterium]|nr:GGDEF domain-containing protein [Lachnospiraceae bacterium]